ncbi:hypothetical protein [Cryptosporangium minutisporangium]|uniref:DUF1049 domain-containing protein n=1 Tax=Cryptosporangium minutisporangium TaxID=113569 RepID=A0ABP6TAR3_9ACTN
MFARFSVLLLAAVLAAPALWQAFVVGNLEVDTALIRYLIAVVLAAAMLGFLQMLWRIYHRIQQEHELQRKLEELRAESERRRAAAAAEQNGDDGPQVSGAA